ncbi:MAG: hypothetical protein NC182_04880 [Prevotella sp.]|nr:hypothetical protein [Staphylococcus sp.]MCM1350518.1 hypothetical protein [Prevotella sp.]
MLNAIAVHCPRCGTKVCDTESKDTHIRLKCANCRRLVDVLIYEEGQVKTAIIESRKKKA